MPGPPLRADLGGFLDAVGEFFSSLADLRWGPLLLGLVFFAIYQSLRARAYFNVLRAAYPGERIAFKQIWAAYIAAYGFNNVVPARGGDVMKVFLVKSSVPTSTYPAVTSSIFVEAVFDGVMASWILVFAFTQGVFPKPPDFSDLGAFDLSFLAAHPRFALFLLTALAVAALVGFALLSARVRAFWARVRQGLTILFDRRRYVREVFLVQLAGWGFRCAAFWMLLEAFGIGGSVENVLLVVSCHVVAAVVPVTPGGAGVVQALLLKVFSDQDASLVAAYSVGQQIAIAALMLGLGFVALVTVFRFRSFRDVIDRGKQARAAEAA